MHLAGFTRKERELLETLLRLVEEGYRDRFDERAAVLLGLSPVTVRTRLSRLKSKYGDVKRFMREYRSWQQKLYQKSGGAFHSL